ncbi:MAG: NADPH-dependent FMN reductase [Bacteroidia bacterium]
MENKKQIFAIVGSASEDSSNLRLVKSFAERTGEHFNVAIFNELRTLPHFSPELSVENTPESIITLRNTIQNSDAVMICTPEYVFSIPSGLKNLLEWCVSTTIFAGKPTAIVTASADGKKGNEELQMILRTLDAKLSNETSLLIGGIKGKINSEGIITDPKTEEAFSGFIGHLIKGI